MARYIDKDKIPYYLDTSEEAPMEGRKIAFKSDVDKIPTADVEEVKHGEWIEDGDYQVCSVCGEEHHWDEYRATYCDACGAKMDGRK